MQLLYYCHRQRGESRLLPLGVKFFQEVLHSLAGILTLAESDLVLSVLSLIDIVLVGSLIVMVMLSGYENFVSKLDADAAQESLSPPTATPESEISAPRRAEPAPRAAARCCAVALV